MSHEIYTSCKRLSPSNWYGMMIFSNCSDSCSHRPAEFASWFWDMTWDDMNLQHIGIVLPAFLTTLDIIHHWNRGTMHERYIDCLSEVGVQNPVFFFLCRFPIYWMILSPHIIFLVIPLYLHRLFPMKQKDGHVGKAMGKPMGKPMKSHGNGGKSPFFVS